MKTLQKITICAALGVLLTGCGKSEESSSEAPVYSEINVSGNVNTKDPFPAMSCGVRLEKAPAKIVCLSPAATEIICELGFKDRIVGICDYCDYPEGLAAPTLGSTENPDINAIIGLKPDAVFTLSALSERDVYTLGQAGISVLTAEPPHNMEGYSTLYREIAAAFYGNEKDGSEKDAAKAVRIGYDARVKLEKTAKENELGSFVYITGKLTAAGANTFESAVLSLSGINFCKAEGYVSADALGDEVPRYIVADNTLTVDDLDGLAAVGKYIAAGAKVRFVNSRCFERPTARTAEVFREIASAQDTSENDE